MLTFTLPCEPQSSMAVGPGRGPRALAAEAGLSFIVSRSVTARASGLRGGLAVSFIEQPGGEERVFAGLGVGRV